jgi:hypothetical protein
MVEFSLMQASTGPEDIASNMPYISIFPPKLCNRHLMHVQPTVKIFPTIFKCNLKTKE